MSEFWFEEFEKRREQCQNLPITKLEATFSEKLLEKYDIIRIGNTEFLVRNQPEKVEGEFKYLLIPYEDPTASLLTSAVPEL